MSRRNLELNISTRQSIDRYLGTIFLVLVRPFVQLTGFVLKIDHSPKPKGEIVVIKMLGGGSLVIAFPSLLGLRRAYPGHRLTLLTTPSVRPFAEVLGLFDRIVVIDDSSLFKTIVTSFAAWAACFKPDTVLNLEVYSKLATVFSLLTMARNRIEFYLENVFWRRHISTHLLFFNRFAGVFLFYEQAVKLIGAEPASLKESRRFLNARLPHLEMPTGTYRIAVGHGCSGFGRERALSADQWCRFIANKKLKLKMEIYFLGSTEDRALADEVISSFQKKGLKLIWHNDCGKKTLLESLSLMGGMDEFWGVDSSLHHFARLLGIPCISFWGPTSPETRLQPMPGLKETILYKRITCSPCIHVAEFPPCRGKNLCIQGHFQKVEENPSWVHNS
jgi:ADP-heptose:LPS heptosyltransferase